jgi:hypothetical protein
MAISMRLDVAVAAAVHATHFVNVLRFGWKMAKAVRSMR